MRTLRRFGTRIRLEFGRVQSPPVRIALVFGAMGTTSLVLGLVSDIWNLGDTGYAYMSATLNLPIAAVAVLVWYARRRTSRRPRR